MTTSKIVKPTEKFKQLLKDLKWAGKDSSTLFNLLAGINRPVTPAHVTKISTSIQKNGNARAVIIVKVDFIDGVMKSYIIDGQHLFFALLRNNMDIPYVTMEVKNKEELVETIALLNTSSKSWTTMDYVSAWSSIVPDYVVLSKMYKTYDLELGQIAELAHTGTLAARSGLGASPVYSTIKKVAALRQYFSKYCLENNSAKIFGTNHIRNKGMDKNIYFKEFFCLKIHGNESNTMIRKKIEVKWMWKLKPIVKANKNIYFNFPVITL